ncbi:hypothetical protein JHK82_053592 [Glycine max]|uniref:Uncharacterized protein n=1 Tax=Glycine max TaxID=3847 RepID=A0A0R0EYB0_SOYBN|nr:hypothetical protein JHK87_053514 [Glycine soja]KAG5083424.1 hypothetical protein JHK84_053462 [Glycine max]KAG5086195.1 hypothetical protein JHK82_053592 [Glycine max]KRG95310.1 hypothetical protein GLYMA_19G142800v4 [Glycine max]
MQRKEGARRVATRRVHEESQQGGCKQNKVTQEKEEIHRGKNNNLHGRETHRHVSYRHG